MRVTALQGKERTRAAGGERLTQSEEHVQRTSEHVKICSSPLGVSSACSSHYVPHASRTRDRGYDAIPHLGLD